MRDFEIGDIVKCVRTCDSRPEAVGLTGTVIHIQCGDDIGVEFKEFIRGHACSGNGQKGYCWYFHDGGHKYLTLVSEPDIEIKTTFDDIFGGEL